jgi:hypothetical protein
MEAEIGSIGEMGEHRRLEMPEGEVKAEELPEATLSSNDDKTACLRPLLAGIEAMEAKMEGGFLIRKIP